MDENHDVTEKWGLCARVLSDEKIFGRASDRLET